MIHNKENPWQLFVEKLMASLSLVEFTDKDGLPVAIDDGMAIWHEMAMDVRKRNGCLYLIGNGASSSLSSHFAADLEKNALMRTQCFTDSALLTAISNDISFERVFAEPLSIMARAGDMLVSISSSGNSPNIIAGIAAARHKMMYVVTLSGMDKTNRSRSMGNLNIYVPDYAYSIVETAHSALLHHWTDRLVASAQRKDI